MNLTDELGLTALKKDKPSSPVSNDGEDMLGEQLVDHINGVLRHTQFEIYRPHDVNLKHNYSLRLEIVDKNDPKAGKVKWESSGVITIDETNEEENHRGVLRIKENSSRIEILDITYQTLANIYRSVETVYPSGLSLSGPYVYANEYYIRTLIDDVILPLGADTPAVRGELRELTRSPNLAIRLEAVKGLEKLGIRDDDKARQRLDEMLNEMDYQTYVKSYGLEKASKEYVDFSQELYRVVIAYARDVIEVQGNVKARVQKAQWRWRPIGYDYRKGRGGFHLIDQDGRLIAFKGDPIWYGAGHQIIYNQLIWDELSDLDIPEITSEALSSFASTPDERKQSFERLARMELDIQITWLETGTPEFSDAEFRAFAELSELSHAGVENLPRLIRLYARNIGHADQRRRDKMNWLLVRQQALHRPEVMNELFKFLVDSNESLDHRLDLAWWLRDTAVESTDFEQFIQKHSNELKGKDRLFLGMTLTLNWWKDRRLSKFERAQKIGLTEEAFFKNFLLAVDQLQQSRFSELSLPDGKFIEISKFSNMSPFQVGQYISVNYGQQLTILYENKIEFKKFMSKIPEIKPAQSSSPITPQEARAMIKGKLAPEYHHLISDTHVQLAQAYEGNFRVAYHPGPPEGIEIIRGEKLDLSSPSTPLRASSPVAEQQGQGAPRLRSGLPSVARGKGQGIASDEPFDKLRIPREGVPSAVEGIRNTSDEVGGIDMNAIDLDRQGAGVDIQFDPVELQEIIDAGIDGFAPVIINIVPLPSVLPLLGLEPANREEELEVSRLN